MALIEMIATVAAAASDCFNMFVSPGVWFVGVAFAVDDENVLAKPP